MQSDDNIGFDVQIAQGGNGFYEACKLLFNGTISKWDCEFDRLTSSLNIYSLSGKGGKLKSLKVSTTPGELPSSK